MASFAAANVPYAAPLHLLLQFAKLLVARGLTYLVASAAETLNR